MTTPATQFKLGLFVLCALAAVALIALALGLHSRPPVVRYHTYFDESVAGLGRGSTVTYRGIRVGNVGDIRVAPDGTRVDVALDITRANAADLDLPDHAGQLRARLDTSGITGVKSVELEPAAPDAPPPELTFAPEERYIPARRSLLDSLEARAERIADQVPVVLDHAVAALDKIEHWLDDFRAQRLAVRIGAVVDHADAAVLDLRRVAQQLNGAKLADKSRTVLDHVDAAAANARDVLARIDRGGELERTVRDVGEAARAFRDLVEEIDREPDMLVKGRARTGHE